MWGLYLSPINIDSSHIAMASSLPIETVEYNHPQLSRMGSKLQYNYSISREALARIAAIACKRCEHPIKEDSRIATCGHYIHVVCDRTDINGRKVLDRNNPVFTCSQCTRPHNPPRVIFKDPILKFLRTIYDDGYPCMGSACKRELHHAKTNVYAVTHVNKKEPKDDDNYLCVWCMTRKRDSTRYTVRELNDQDRPLELLGDALSSLDRGFAYSQITLHQCSSCVKYLLPITGRKKGEICGEPVFSPCGHARGKGCSYASNVYCNLCKTNFKWTEADANLAEKPSHIKEYMFGIAFTSKHCTKCGSNHPKENMINKKCVWCKAAKMLLKQDMKNKKK